MRRKENVALCFKIIQNTTLNVRAKPGRPRIEEDQLLLLETIVDIAMYGSASHERR